MQSDTLLQQQLSQALEHHQQGQLKRARILYQQILTVHPNHPDTLHLLGVLEFSLGQYASAATYIKQAITIQASPHFYNSLGNIHRALGQLDMAQETFEKALEAEPLMPEAHNNLGAIFQLQGKSKEALLHYQKAIEIKPDYLEAICNLGMSWQETGDFEKAKYCFQQALEQNPNMPETHNLMGMTYQALGDLPLAIRHYQQALEMAPNYPEVHYNLANALKAKGQIDTAIQHYQQALALTPDFTNAHYNLASTHLSLGQPEQALGHFHEVLRLDPTEVQVHSKIGGIYQNMGHFELAAKHFQKALDSRPTSRDHLNLGLCLQAQGKFDTAIEQYQQALALNPESESAHCNLGNVLREQGRTQEAQKHYCQADKQVTHDGYRVRSALLLPPVYGDQNDLLAWRQHFEEGVDTLLQKKLQLSHPYQEVGTTNFYLAYQGQNDRILQEKIAQIYRPFLPENQFTNKQKEKKKIGFISGFFYNHSVSHYYAPMIRELPKEHFHVTLFSTPDMKVDQITEEYQQAVDQFIRLPNDLSQAREVVAKNELDILVYTDIGMDPFTYFLAFTRLAPIQCVLSGHPVTTGIPTLDYFISSELMEGPDADSHYSEKLICPSGIPARYPQAEISGPLKTKTDLGLPPNNHLYVCPMTLFKIQPDFDQALADILRQDLKGQVILFQYRQTALHDQLQERFLKTMPDVLSRIQWIPWSCWDDFLQILYQADVVLDTFHFSGANTAFITLSFGTPMVTWPSPYMRGRLAHGLYRRLELSDCVAHSKEDYVRIACALGCDRDNRDAVSQKILERHHVLYDNPEGIQAMTQFFADL